MRLLQYREHITKARILSTTNEKGQNAHCLLLTIDDYDIVAIKSGFRSGYHGQGPRTLSYVLALLEDREVEIEEYEVDQAFIDRVDGSALLTRDIEWIENKAGPLPMHHWQDYINVRHMSASDDGTLWTEWDPWKGQFREIIPYAILDPRIVDLAHSFWEAPDDRLFTAYKRLEGIVRKRTSLESYGHKLFSQAFRAADAPLFWKGIDDGEREGRANIFIGVYMAHRNPRAHGGREGFSDVTEFLVLNHLYLLERCSVLRNASGPG